MFICDDTMCGFGEYCIERFGKGFPLFEEELLAATKQYFKMQFHDRLNSILYQLVNNDKEFSTFQISRVIRNLLVFDDIFFEFDDLSLVDRESIKGIDAKDVLHCIPALSEICDEAVTLKLENEKWGSGQCLVMAIISTLQNKEYFQKNFGAFILSDNEYESYWQKFLDSSDKQKEAYELAQTVKTEEELNEIVRRRSGR